MGRIMMKGTFFDINEYEYLQKLVYKYCNITNADLNVYF